MNTTYRARLTTLLRTSRRFDAGLRLRWGHGIHWFVGSRQFELGSMRDLCRSRLFRLDAFNILELGKLATAPFRWPGGMTRSLGVSNICKEIPVTWRLRQKKKKNIQVPGFTFFTFLRASRPSSDVSCWGNRFGAILRGIVTGRIRKAQGLALLARP